MPQIFTAISKNKKRQCKLYYIGIIITLPKTYLIEQNRTKGVNLPANLTLYAGKLCASAFVVLAVFANLAANFLIIPRE